MTITRILLVSAVLLAGLAPSASANSYWVDLASSRGEIAHGVNGFTWHAIGGPYNAYGSHCDAQPGSYIAGSYCKLRLNIPAGLTAGAPTNGGIARGGLRTANDNFVLRSERPGGNPATVVDSPGDGEWNHGWGALGSYFEVGLRTNNATQTSAISNWFHINSVAILMHDPSNPTIAALGAPGGWLGPGCHAVTYGFSDTGSQMWSTSLVNLTTGATIHNWNANPGITLIQSGVPTAAFTPCVPATSTGAHTLRMSGADRSGNSISHDFAMHFDVTRPEVSAPTRNAAPLTDGATITGSYRPTITWTIGDAHSGIARVTTRVDQTPLAHQRSGSTVTIAPEVDLPLGSHVISIDVTDNVGNTTTVTRHVNITDTTAPTINVAQPGAIGGNTPILDVTAADDRTGITAASWKVRVNGQPLLVTPTGARVQADLGYLVAGTHTIDIAVADVAGNTTHSTVQYTATLGSGNDALPGLTGIYVLDAPDTITSGQVTRIRAAAVKHGRPLAGMRAELRQGSVTVAGKPISADGTVDIALTLTTSGPLTLTVNGSGLDDQTIQYTFVARTTATPAPTDTSPAGAAAPGDQPTASGGGVANAAVRPATRPAIVARIIDGDTIKLRDGRTVQLLQVDAPETNECYGARATRQLRRILKPGIRIALSADARLAKVDHAGRLLRYVTARGTNVNRLLVQRGAAMPHFTKNRRGRLATSLLGDARVAKRNDRGLWRTCDGVRLSPRIGADTGLA